MAIPDLLPTGLLTPGFHECVLDDVGSRFGTLAAGPKRPALFRKLCEFLERVRALGIFDVALIDGSFVTAKRFPSDVDVILVTKTTVEFESLYDVEECHWLFDDDVVRTQYRVDCQPCSHEDRMVGGVFRFFQGIRPGLAYALRVDRSTLKGILKVQL